jgi:LmbE family N-acetylglucosaminyl deacetylase
MTLKNKAILIISPHLDDEVIDCGGLLEAARRQKAEVFVLYIYSGRSRQLVTGRTSEDVRLKELEAVAQSGHFQYKILFTGDEFLRLDQVAQKDLVDPIEDQIEAFKPDIVCVPFRDSYNQDHRPVYTACLAALRPIPQTIRHFVSVVLMYDEPYSWTVNELFKPNWYLDISGFETKKAELMRLYATQNRAEPFPRSGENLIRYARIRGSEIGVQAAEAYQLLRGVMR